MDDRLFGGVVALLAASAVHRNWTVADLGRLIAPPIQLGQYAVIRRRDQITAYGSWALLSEEAENGYVTGQRKIQPGDWRSGDRLWLIDLVAPHGEVREIATLMRADMVRRGFGGRTYSFRRVMATSKRMGSLTI